MYRTYYPFLHLTLLLLAGIRGQKPYNEMFFGYGAKTKVMFGTPAQEMYIQIRFEDEYIYLITQECIRKNLCYVNDTVNYFVPGQSTTFYTQMKIFDGSTTYRAYPSGIWAEDNIQVSTLSRKLRFGMVDKAPFLIQGNGVFGLKWSRKQDNHINQMLKQYRYPYIGIGLMIGLSEAYPYNGELIFGGGSKRCQGIYEYLEINTQRYDTWIFDIKRFVFGQVTITSEIPVTFTLGQEFTIFPDEMFNRIVIELDARQSNSQQPTFYVRSNGAGFPVMGFEVNGIILTMRPNDYLGKLTPYGYELKIQPKFDRSIPTDQIVFGDNFIQRYCLLLDYSIPPKIGFALSSTYKVVPNIVVIFSIYFLLKFTR